MAITTPPTTPVRTMAQETFDSTMALFVAWFATFVSEINPVIEDIDVVQPLLQPAIDAVSSSNTLSSSTTSTTIPTSVPSSKSITLADTGKSFSVGHSVMLISSANPYNWMVGTITAFTAGTGAMTVNVLYTYGTGTYTDWIVALCPLPMTTTNNAIVALSATYQMKAADKGQFIEASGTWSLTYEAAATLGNGWYHWIETAASSVITLDPNGSETIDTPASATSSTYVLPAGVRALIRCNGTKLKLIIIGVGNHEVVVHTGNGHGSTNTKIRRFTTTMTNTGTAITYADSAANGASFTINETGLYAIYYADAYNSGTVYHGITVNSAALTTDITAVTVASRLAMQYQSTSTAPAAVSRTVLLNAGDVIRPHTTGSNDSVSSTVYFAIRKVGPA